jgi:predicted CopG family antitoxin
MATKTITIDVEAYRRLKAIQADKESFSQTIKRVIRPPLDLKDFKKRLRGHSLSNDALKAVERHISDRHRISKRKR